MGNQMWWESPEEFWTVVLFASVIGAFCTVIYALWVGSSLSRIGDHVRRLADLQEKRDKLGR